MDAIGMDAIGMDAIGALRFANSTLRLGDDREFLLQTGHLVQIPF